MGIYRLFDTESFYDSVKVYDGDEIGGDGDGDGDGEVTLGRRLLGVFSGAAVPPGAYA